MKYNVWISTVPTPFQSELHSFLDSPTPKIRDVRNSRTITAATQDIQSPPLVILLLRQRAGAYEGFLAHSPFHARALTLQSRVQVAHLARQILETARFRPSDLASKTMPQTRDEGAPTDESPILLEGAHCTDRFLQDGTSSAVEV